MKEGDMKRLFEQAERLADQAKKDGMPQEILNQLNQLEATATLNALVEILIDKKIIDVKKFVEIKRKHAQAILDYNLMGIELGKGKPK